MKFEFTAHAGFDFLESFANQFDIPQPGNMLIIPDRLGHGSVRKVDFAPDFKLLFHSYTFNEPFTLKRIAPEEQNDIVSIIFYTTAIPNNYLSNKEKTFTNRSVGDSIVEVASNDLNSEIRFPAETEILFTVVGIRKAKLASLLNLDKPTPLVENITQDRSSFLYNEKMGTDIEKEIEHLKLINEQDPLSKLSFKNKVQELIYFLFRQLLKRGCSPQQGVRNADVKKIHTIRSTILQDLSNPPKLADLARKVGMSKTKMKQLFKQIHEDSIYNYYLEARMEDAAYMLKHANVSVSEVGHRIGYTNMSHFSRMFKKHYGTNPKSYISVG